MSKLFGGKDPFDDPFFTTPFNDFFGGNLFDHPFLAHPFGDQPGSSKQVTIEELNPDDEDGVKTSDGGKELIVKNPNKNGRGRRLPLFLFIQSAVIIIDCMLTSFLIINGLIHLIGKHSSVAYRRVAYGGVNGMYYTCSEGRMIGDDGVSSNLSGLKANALMVV